MELQEEFDNLKKEALEAQIAYNDAEAAWKKSKSKANTKAMEDAADRLSDAETDLTDFLEDNPEFMEEQAPGEKSGEKSGSSNPSDEFVDISKMPVILQKGKKVDQRPDLFAILNKDKIVIHQKGKAITKAPEPLKVDDAIVIAKRGKSITGSAENRRAYNEQQKAK